MLLIHTTGFVTNSYYSHTKTVTAAFHLHNRETKRELKVCNIGKTLPFCPVPTYLGVKLDRSLTYCPHLEALRKKLCTRVSLLRRLVGTGWVLAPRHYAQLPCLWSSRLPSTAHQSGAAACTYGLSTVYEMTPCALSLGACVPLHRSTFRFFQASSQLSFAAKERHSPQPTAAPLTLTTFYMASFMSHRTYVGRD